MPQFCSPRALRFAVAAALSLGFGASFASATTQPTPDGAAKTNESHPQEALPPATTEPAEPAPHVGDKLAFSFGTDFSSHFISFGADVWGGGNTMGPFSSDATQFVYGTGSAKFTDELSGFINVWSDVNNNVDSEIGGWVQEIDFNVGLTYAWNGITFGIAHNYWIYGGDEEYAVEASIGYNDADLWKDTVEGFALNPSLLYHHRYEGWGEQEEAGVLQLGVRPTFTFMTEDKYPITLAVPAAIAFFTDDYQGGDGGGYGYFNIGLSASVPLAFIPSGYGNWTASVSASYWNTPDSAIPGNPKEDFIVTALSVGVSF